MTDWPLPFRPPMVRSLLAGLKTKTRRILSPRTTLFNGRPWSGLAKAQTWDWDKAWVDPGPSPAGPYLKLPWLAGDADPFEETVHRIYPKVQPGDRLWVKEAHYLIDDGEAVYPVYAADEHAGDRPLGRQRPAMFMPRRASRITLIVTDIGFERLQATSDEDALAEGCEPSREFVGWWRCYTDETHLCPTLRDSFISLWESIHGPGAWEANPWVTVLGFQVVKANIDAWWPMDTAPRDGTAFQARIPGHGEDNIIAWMNGLVDSSGNDCGSWYFVEEQEPPDCWTDGICWTENADGEASVQPTHWKSLARTMA